MKSQTLILSCFISLFSSLSLCAVEQPSVSTNLKLWPTQPPGSQSSSKYREEIVYRDAEKTKSRISKVTEPNLEVFLPAADKANGTAVVICPGGGYTVLAYDHEGIDVAKFFNELGIAAFILKYRLPSDEIMVDKKVGPLQDVQEAIRTVRRRAAEYRVNPAKIGIMGFSAGGHLAGSASTLYTEQVYEPSDATSARPDFSILVYGVLSFQQDISHGGSRKKLLGANPDQATLDRFSAELRVNAQTPPAFLIHSQDDSTVNPENSLRYFQAMTRFKVPCELHIYPSGGHGYGLGVNPNSPSQWPESLKHWLKSRQLL